MFEKISPEKAGIKSESVLKFIKFLEKNGLVTHSLLMMRGNSVFAEAYWAPFDENFCHRMYSQTKSYVGVAIGLLEEEGKLSLDDKIVSHFPEKIDTDIHPLMKEQTIREMLTMTTCANAPYWFDTSDPDRVHEYFNASEIVRPSGTVWEYDSPGSQVLCALVEKLSGKTLMEYLDEKIFRHLGTFKTAEMLKTPNGDSWGDSALLCTIRDMASFARFVMNYGIWDGKRLMNEAYLRTATSKVVDNAVSGFSAQDKQGYGYQIWRHDMNGFSFNGMGCQYTICVPEKDFIFVITSDNQGYQPAATPLIFRGLKEFIVENLGSELPENPDAQNELEEYIKTLKLYAVSGDAKSDFEAEINGKIYGCEKNPQGIKWFSFDFDENGVTWNYENAQGKKSIRCGRCENNFTKFPQLGYSNEIGGARTTDGFMYDCAASAAWLSEKSLHLKIQIIDRYFGNMSAIFSFKGDFCAVNMVKTAEDFLKEYQGDLISLKRN